MSRRGVVRCALVQTALALGCGCVAGGGPGEERGEATARHDIVGGSTEAGFPLVGALAVSYRGWGYSAFCTATAVTPTVVVSAAHCLDSFSELYGHEVVFYQTFADGSSEATPIDVTSATTHPRWSGDGWTGYTKDIGVARLRRPLDADLYPQLHSAPLDRGDIGAELLAVGFGVTSVDSEDSGIKRSIELVLTQVWGDFFGVGLPRPDEWRGVCYGDSGGPTFLIGDHRDVQYGVHARTSSEACGPGEDTSVGDFFDDFLRGAVLDLDPTAEDCGDGVCTGLEDEVGCPRDCAPYECGDGFVEPPEVCDDGNEVGGDGCSADCLSDESCGNGVVDADAGELCDDGNEVGGDGCSADCSSDERCGNGVVDDALGELCDDGNDVGGDGCSRDCLSDESCGNGVVDTDAGEMCDDGNVELGDGCSADCASDESCGNGVIDRAVGEACDDGNTADGDDCSADCAVSMRCGDGVVDGDLGEVCDDGNNADRDGCAGDCLSDELCGNGVVDFVLGEACDDGNTADGDDCPADCGVELPRDEIGCGCRAASSRGGLSGAMRALLSLF